MIDPFHMMASRADARAGGSSSSKPTGKSAPSKQPSADAGNTSKSSSVDSKSHQSSSSYFGGENLSPTSTTSTDHATKGSFGGSSTSSLQHKLPEFEHFKQSSPLMPEFYPRTSEFFSHGRRRSSIAIPEGHAAAGATVAPAIPEALNARNRSGSGPKKAETFSLPLTFEEEESLVGEQLPVRLGLAPPSHKHGLSGSDATYKARVGYGYYFYTPPPKPAPHAAPAARRPSISLTTAKSSSGPGSLRRRNTDTSEKVLSPTKTTTPLSTSPAPMSPSATPTRARANSYISGVHSSTQAQSSTGNRLPPPSPDCWHPDSYFTTTRSRVKGKTREYKYHGFPPSVVPYWHGYNSETLEAEMSTHLNVTAAMKGTHTLRPFPEGSRPCRVLDLGCGRGMWCLDVARAWKTTEIVGLDIVPIQPNLAQLGDKDLEHRVSWVVANFLEPLPFPDASFDYVHVRFILQGVPEDKWVDIFSEARRILAPGGVLEVMEGNYAFFGHASLVDVQEVKELENGSASSKKGSAAKLPKRLKVLNDASESADIDAIEVILERMMHRRFINPTPLSVVPSALLLPGFSNVANGNPRHLPVYAESTAQRAKASASAAAALSSPIASSSDDEEKREGKYTSRGQIGKPLQSQFTMVDADLFCAFVILQQLDFFSSSRELIWLEAEEEKRNLQGHASPHPDTIRMDTSRRFGQGNPAALKPFAHPWKSKDQFFRAMDAWIDATRTSADTEHILKKYLGWEQAHEDLTVEGRKYAERRRKMSTSSVAIPSLGLGEMMLEPQVEENAGSLEASCDSQEVLDAEGTGGSYGHHEAPARLQSTRTSAPDTHEIEAARLAAKEEKKKKSKRPSSSGSGSGTAGVGAGSTLRTRAFGRGGMAAHVPLPDAPAFMAGYAFGPAQKAKVEPAGRPRQSISDRSSVSAKTETVDSTASRTTSQSQQQDMSAAAAYAATQRVSHGIEDEYRLQDDSGRRLSRPVSPTSSVPAASLGARPPLGAQGTVDARSVSMPAQVGSLRIAEPLVRPSRLKSNDKEVAMIGFYDTTGYIATV